MKKLFLWASGALMSLLLITAANAGPNDLPAQTNDSQSKGPVTNSGSSPDTLPTIRIYDNLDQDEQVTRPKKGISWREQVIKERTIMRRAGEMRNANLRNAQMGIQEKIEGLGVDSYNSLILQRNAELGN